MKRRTRDLAVAAAVLAVLAAGSAAAGPSAGRVGDPAADFNLEQYGGGWRSLGEFQGKVVFLAVVGYG